MSVMRPLSWTFTIAALAAGCIDFDAHFVGSGGANGTTASTSDASVAGSTVSQTSSSQTSDASSSATAMPGPLPDCAAPDPFAGAFPEGWTCLSDGGVPLLGCALDGQKLYNALPEGLDLISGTAQMQIAARAMRDVGVIALGPGTRCQTTLRISERTTMEATPRVALVVGVRRNFDTPDLSIEIGVGPAAMSGTAPRTTSARIRGRGGELAISAAEEKLLGIALDGGDAYVGYFVEGEAAWRLTRFTGAWTSLTGAADDLYVGVVSEGENPAASVYHGRVDDFGRAGRPIETADLLGATVE